MTSEQILRRQILGAGVVGAAAMSWSCRLPAADDLSTLSFVIVSDTHLGRNDNVLAELSEGRFTMRYKPLDQELNGKYAARFEG